MQTIRIANRSLHVYLPSPILHKIHMYIDFLSFVWIHDDTLLAIYIFGSHGAIYSKKLWPYSCIKTHPIFAFFRLYLLIWFRLSFQIYRRIERCCCKMLYSCARWNVDYHTGMLAKHFPNVGCKSVARVEQRVRRSQSATQTDRTVKLLLASLATQSVVFMAFAKANRTQQNVLKLPGDVFHNSYNANECRPDVDHSRQSSVIPQRFSLINFVLRQFVWSYLVSVKKCFEFDIGWWRPCSYQVATMRWRVQTFLIRCDVRVSLNLLPSLSPDDISFNIVYLFK